MAIRHKTTETRSSLWNNDHVGNLTDLDDVTATEAEGDTLVRNGSSTWVNVKNAVNQTTAPGVGDDSDDGYAIGSMWFDTTADISYQALDVSVGSAVWLIIASGVTGHTKYTDAEAITAVEGEATLALAGEVDIAKKLSLSAFDTFNATGNLDDFDSVNNSTLFWTGNGNYDITGVVADGQGTIWAVLNADTNNTLTIKDQDANSSTANRFDLNGTDVVLQPGDAALLFYHADGARWFILSRFSLTQEDLVTHEAASDPHTQYSLASGTRSFTGDVTVVVAARADLALNRTSTVTDDVVGRVVFQGNGFDVASIVAQAVTNNPATGDSPGQIKFQTTPDGSATLVSAWTIDKDGNLIPTTADGDFGLTGSRVNKIWGDALDIGGNIVVGGTVDGVDIATRDHAKFTGAEAITAVEGESALVFVGGMAEAGRSNVSVAAGGNFDPLLNADLATVGVLSLTGSPAADFELHSLTTGTQTEGKRIAMRNGTNKNCVIKDNSSGVYAGTELGTPEDADYTLKPFDVCDMIYYDGLWFVFDNQSTEVHTAVAAAHHAKYTDAEAHAFVEANALSLTADMTIVQAAQNDINLNRTSAVAGSILGTMSFKGNGFDIARIYAVATTNTPATGDSPGDLVLQTTPDGSATLVSAWVVNRLGDFYPSTADGDVGTTGARVNKGWFDDADVASTITLGAVSISVGSGTPEAAVTAVIGSTFHRTDGGAATSFYVKESGTGNTGWVAK